MTGAVGMTGARSVRGAAEMLPLVELTEIKVYEVRGRRIEATDDAPRAEPTESMSVHARGADTWLETRGRLVVHTLEADILADAGAVFSFSAPLDVTEAVAAEFVEKVGVMAVYPFLREHVFTTASRLGVAPPVIGLLRAGGFKVDPSTGTGSEG